MQYYAHTVQTSLLLSGNKQPACLTQAPCLNRPVWGELAYVMSRGLHQPPTSLFPASSITRKQTTSWKGGGGGIEKGGTKAFFSHLPCAFYQWPFPHVSGHPSINQSHQQRYVSCDPNRSSQLLSSIITGFPMHSSQRGTQRGLKVRRHLGCTTSQCRQPPSPICIDILPSPDQIFGLRTATSHGSSPIWVGLSPSKGLGTPQPVTFVRVKLSRNCITHTLGRNTQR
ncbi:hypothetical protein CDEST_13747 [Colletotrichum destructivum]|uniref:Uncharacterized protein n=1 Tax=Colletotrichum destructivum TaxID=34406 RepID=A0AAX4IZY8_9PEZI|nr:hypothetical protein CDEST_13747 [Colletotrichum destructivum]